MRVCLNESETSLAQHGNIKVPSTSQHGNIKVPSTSRIHRLGASRIDAEEAVTDARQPSLHGVRAVAQRLQHRCARKPFFF